MMIRRVRRLIRLLPGILLLAGLIVGPAQGQSPTETSCTICHGDSEWFDPEKTEIVDHFRSDVHADVGLSCHSCHGGNPDPALADDFAAAMDEDWARNPYIGVPEAPDVPSFCGRCHSSPAFMRRFKPDVRVDQVQEYWTSRHGMALRQGDTSVATCIDCHGTHGTLRVTNPKSRVYPTQVAETCGACHSNPERMAGRTDESGRPLSVDQVARWKRSVHATAMFEKADLSAPTCNDCHGNHGATPPGVESVAFVCGNCHGREAELFRASAKHDAFVLHNELIADGTGCETCHEGLSPNVVNIRRFTECVTCHENHAVMRPTIAFLGSLPETPCTLCHEASTVVVEPKAARANYLQLRNELLDTANRAGMSDEARFDWLVDQALALPTHTMPAPGSDQRQLRPEFERLFQKFRIGKTHFTYPDPVSGEDVVVRIRQCGDCHVDPESEGLRTANRHVQGMSRLIGATARAERILLAAQRGGVEVGAAREALDAAVDSQIELEVLVHSFDADGEFGEKYEEGLTHATAALSAGQESLDELSYRRRGLFWALGVILIALIALGLKIRRM